MKILVVDDSATMRAGLAHMVERMGHQALVASGATDGLRTFHRERPDLVLLDVLMDETDGYAMAREIRAVAKQAWIPIIFLSSREADQDLERAIEAGGDDYLVKPVSYVVLHSKIRAMQRIDKVYRRLVRIAEELELANQELEELSHRDALTGIANRRSLDERLAAELDSAQRNAKPLSLLLVDIDELKSFNDQYGHVSGDACLTDVAHTLKQACRRASDLAARYGGDEFAVLLPNCTAPAARKAADVLLNAVRKLALPHAGSPFGHVTLSIGVFTTVPTRGVKSVDVLAHADLALYAAKRDGKNQLSVFEPSDNAAATS